MSISIKPIIISFALTLGLSACSSAYGEEPLTGSITKVDFNGELAAHAQKLTDVAMERDETAQYVQKMIKKFSSMPHKAKTTAAEFAYAIVPYRGFSPSKEGSQILLERIKKVKSLAAAEYINQRFTDDFHTRIISALLQISEGLDSVESLRGKQLVARAYNDLKTLVGDERADETVLQMSSWSKGLNVPGQAFSQATWDLGTLQDNVHKTTSICVGNDPVFKEVVKKLNKYNRGKFMTALGSIVESSCALGSIMAPGFLAPLGAELINATFVTSTGGCEQTKMVKQMYTAKRMESRWKRLNEESSLALTAYEMALQHKSPTLLATSESVMRNLIGNDQSKDILGQAVLPDPEPTNPYAADESAKPADKKNAGDADDSKDSDAEKTSSDSDTDTTAKKTAASPANPSM